jgi:hypothetical protein
VARRRWHCLSRGRRVGSEGAELAGMEEAKEGDDRHGRKTPRSELAGGRKMKEARAARSP